MSQTEFRARRHEAVGLIGKTQEPADNAVVGKIVIIVDRAVDAHRRRRVRSRAQLILCLRETGCIDRTHLVVVMQTLGEREDRFPFLKLAQKTFGVFRINPGDEG